MTKLARVEDVVKDIDVLIGVLDCIRQCYALRRKPLQLTGERGAKRQRRSKDLAGASC